MRGSPKDKVSRKTYFSFVFKEKKSHYVFKNFETKIETKMKLNGNVDSL